MKVEEIKNILNSKGITFGALEYNTSIKTSAKYKNLKIRKHTNANVQLFQSITDFELYKKQVIRSANQIVENGEVTEFETSETWFTHDEVFSIIRSKKTDESYLYFIANSAKSEYFLDDVQVDKEAIREYLTPSDAKKVFENDGIVYNKTNDVYHMVQPRTLKIDNIVRLKTNGIELV